jgi:hypothetical protein
LEKLRNYQVPLSYAAAALLTSSLVSINQAPAQAFELAPMDLAATAEVQPGQTEEGKVASRLASQIAVQRTLAEAQPSQTPQTEVQVSPPNINGVTDYWFGTQANYDRVVGWSKTHPYVIANAKTFYTIAKQAGLSNKEIGCGENIIAPESSFDQLLQNQSGSSAYGIGQALPGSKMGKYGPDWQHNVVTQIKWFLAYTGASATDTIKGRFNSVCDAWNSRKNGGTY